MGREKTASNSTLSSSIEDDLGPWFCKVWSLQERQHHLGTWQKISIWERNVLGPHDPLQLRGWGLAICSPASSPGDPEARSSLRTTGLRPALNLVLVWKEGDICHLPAKTPSHLSGEPDPATRCPHTRIQVLDRGQGVSGDGAGKRPCGW